MLSNLYYMYTSLLNISNRTISDCYLSTKGQKYPSKIGTEINNKPNT